jgi:hypothetical protein
MAEEIIDNPDFGAYAQQNQDAIYRLITGANPADLAEQVRILGGTRAAAEAAGVTQRTVQRWITKTGTQKIQHPKADTLGRVNAAATQTRATREGRERIAGGRRATLMRHHGARMRGTGRGGIVTPGGERGYVKDRRFDFSVGANVMDDTYSAYIDGGEDAAFETFNTSFGDEYSQQGAFFEGWMFTDMTGLGFTPGLSPDE